MSILEVKGLQYSYENKKRVLRGINAQMEQGKMYAILGPSGCGKTTLLYQILQRNGMDAWAAAAGFHSVEEAMQSPGTGAFIRASMRVLLDAEAREKGGG